MTEKKWKILRNLLLIGSVMAAIKMIFFDYTMDEEYQIMMAYRNIKGDHLFTQMWEPHQTSAFMCVGLMRLYKWITGTFTGVIVFLRVCTTAIQVGFALYMYKFAKVFTEKRYAFLIAVFFFNVVPKQIQIPEFANMQLWFFMLTLFPLMHYWALQKEKQKASFWLIILAGIGMALEVLAYPSCLLLFPFFLVCIWFCSKEHRIRDAAVFSGTCAVCGGAWLLLVLTNLPFAEFMENVQNVVGLDLTHEISGATSGKFQGIVTGFVNGLGLLAIIFALSGLIFAFLRKKSLYIFACLLVMVSAVVQVFYWVVLESGYELPQIHLVVIWIAALLLWKQGAKDKKLLLPGLLGSLLSIVAVIYLSDLVMVYSLLHGFIGPVFALILMCLVVKRENETEDVQNLDTHKKWLTAVLLSLCFMAIFGKGYTMRGGGDYASVLETRGIMKHGPAAGILADYMCAYIYNANYEDFNTYVQDGDNVLIVTNMVFSPGTTPYMFRDVEICHYSIVDPTAYDERLVTYWEKYPEKYPNVIVVDCWYGELKENPNNWIMQYIENEFDYTQVNDGKYVRFYRK